MNVKSRQKVADAVGVTLVSLGTINAIYGGYRELSAHLDLAGFIVAFILLVPSMIAFGFLWWFFRWRRKKEKEEKS